jgi:hypothetical protein
MGLHIVTDCFRRAEAAFLMITPRAVNKDLAGSELAKNSHWWVSICAWFFLFGGFRDWQI